MFFSLILEITLTALLAATLVYCAILERRLSALRKGQDGFRQTIADLNAAIVSAGQSMRDLKASAAQAAATLEERLERARGAIDELSLLASSGERIAQRIERGAVGQSAVTKSAAIRADRLEAFRPQRGEDARMPAMGNVR